MDFHALPRRDLQALCKRNGIRASMTNVAMADALAALPAAVDGIDKEAAAEEGEMQGILLPGGGGVEPVSLMPNQDEEKAPALDVGRRRATAPSMDFHALPRRDLQALCKRNGIRASMTNVAMADALAALPAAVDGIDKEAAAEEGEMQGILLPGGSGVEPVSLMPNQDEEKAPALDVGRRRATAPSMDFHALPRRDLQALCKRNGIRANMTNLAMADALAALPAVVDGIDKEAAAEEGEMQGISLPGGGGVEPVALMPNQDEEKAPALDVGRRRASRRARVEPVASPATTKRAAESMAAETVPARTTRARTQRAVVSATKARRMPRAVARKTSTEQEEEEKGAQEDVSDECVVDLSGQERWPDVVQQCEGSPIFRNDTVSSEKIHDAIEDIEMVPVNELPLAILKSCEAAEEVDLTSGATEKNEIPISCEMLQSSRKAIEEKEDNNTDMSAEEGAVVVTDGMRSVTMEDGEKEPALGMELRRASRRAWVKPVAAPATRKRAAGSMAETATDAMLARTTRARSQRMMVLAPEEEAPKARQMPRRAVARKTSMEQEEEEKGTHGDVFDECVVDSSVHERQPHVQRCEDSPFFRNDTVSSKEIHHTNQDTEMGPVNELPLATLKSGEAAEEVDFTCGTSEENEIPTSGEMLRTSAKAIEEKEDMVADEMTNYTDMSAEEEAVLATDEMPQRSATVGEGVIEVVTVDNLSQATVTDDGGVFKESGFTGDLTDVSIEEEEVVATDEMALSLATMDESVKEEAIPFDYLSQATVTDDEGAVKESGFSCDPTGVSVEKKGVVAADGMPQSLATPDESVEQVVTIDNLSQATLTDDEESGFNCDLADVSVDEAGVVAADEMSQRSATLDESVKEEVATMENLSQATITDGEWVVKESAFTGDLPPFVDTARGFSDHIASPLSADMLEIATKSMLIDSITGEPMVSEADDVPLRMHSNSGGQKTVAELVAVEREKEGKESEALGSLSLRKLRIKLKEKVAVERENEMKEGKKCEALGSLSLRKFRSLLKEKMVVAQENEADDVPLCMYGSIGGEKNASEPVAVEGEEEMKEDKGSEVLGSLSLRKLRTKLNEKVAVAQKNEVKEGKESMTLDKLSLRKLKMKLKETMNAQKAISKFHPSM